MIGHEDDWLLGNGSVLVGRQDVVTALDLLDRSGFTRRILTLDDLHERAGYEAVAALFLSLFFFLFLFFSSVCSRFIHFFWLRETRIFAFRTVSTCSTLPGLRWCFLLLGCVGHANITYLY